MTNAIFTNYLVYTADPWQSKGSFRVRGIMQNLKLAEGLKRSLIKNDVEDSEHIHILSVDANECFADGGYLL